MNRQKILLLVGTACFVIPLLINSLAGRFWVTCGRNLGWGSNFRCTPHILVLLSFIVYAGIFFLLVGSLMYIWRRSNVGKILKTIFSLLAVALLVTAGMFGISSLETGTSVYGVARSIIETRAYIAEREYRKPLSCRGQDCKKLEKIPVSVIKAYDTYANELVRVLVYCSKGKEEIYKVGGGGGFTGTNEFFDGTGKKLAETTFTDAISINTPLPYDLHGYTCTALTPDEVNI